MLQAGAPGIEEEEDPKLGHGTLFPHPSQPPFINHPT
jgi:hypothetical protein